MNSARARRLELLFLAFLLILGLGLRAYRVGQPSLAEDEAAKWDAVQQYRQGHFAAVNSEHPMVMKMLAWASLACWFCAIVAGRLIAYVGPVPGL